MAVQEQTPYIEHVANGVTTSFALGFVCDSADMLVVTVNDLPTNVGDWSFSNGNVVFQYPPLSESIIKIWRNSPLARSTTFKTYDNSLNPNSLNFDLDKIWLVMQELNVKNSFSDSKLQTLLDSLIAGNVNGLPAEIVARISGDEASKLLINFEVMRAYQAENELGTKIENEAIIASQNNLAEKERAEAVEQSLQDQVNSVGVGNKAYKTYAEMNADKANIAAKSKVTVTNDPTASNNGDWQWDGLVFTKSAYEALVKPDLPIELKNNLYTGVNTLGFYVRPADGFIIAATSNEISVLAVEAGKTYTVTATDMRASYLIVSCSATSSVSGGKQNTLATLNSTADPNIKTFTVPTGMKYAFINVLWPNFNFDIRSSLVVQEGSALKYAVKSARGVPIIDTLAQQRLDDFESEGLITGTSVLPSDSGPVVTLTTHNDLNVAPTTGALRTSVGCKLVQFNIVAGKRYKIMAPDLRAAYVVVSVSSTSSVSSGKAQTLATLTEIDATTKIFTAPENMISACINTVWPNFNLDISTSLSVEELEPFAVSQIAGAPIVDTLAQEKIKALEESSGGTGSGYISILKNKKWVFIGDSITASDNAWATTRYHDYVVNVVGGMTTQNLGISSSGYGDRTTAASYITLPSPDYITLFMGTNDFGYLNDLRNSEGKPYPMGAFLSSTNLTVSGAINLTLTNIFAAYPLAKVAIITPLPRGTLAENRPNFGENPAPNVDGVNLENIANELIRYAKHYSLPILDLYHQSNFLASSTAFQNACMTDGVHPNDAGHLILGQKVLKFLESI